MVAVLALAFGIGLLLRPAPTPARRLPDGSVIALEGVTYGKVHEVVHGAWWQKLLLPMLPTPLQQDFERRFRCNLIRTISKEPNALVFWCAHRDAARGRSGRWWNRPRHAVAFDEHGREFEGGSRRSVMLLPGPTTGILEAWEIPAFPRRGKRVGVRLYYQSPGGEWVQGAEFIVSNPAPGRYPTWAPSPLPITRRAGDLAFALTGLTADVSEAVLPRPAAGRETAWTRATFRITRDSRPAAWEPVGITITDATGNVWTPRTHFADRREGQAHLYFLGSPSPEESAWKLSVEFARTAEFAPWEEWTARGVPVPGPGGFARARQAATLHGVGITHVSLFTPARSVPQAGWRQGMTRVHLLLSRPPEGLRLTLVRATDDRGRTVPTTEIVRTHTDREYGANLRVPPGAKTLDLTFALHKTRAVEFLVAPPGEG